MYYKYIHCIQKELDSSLKPVPSNPLSLPWNSSPPLLASLPTTILLGKICYKTLKDYGLCCETPEDRVFARGHYKKVVISCWTLIPLFYYFRSKWREKSCVSTKIPLYSVLPLTSFLFPIFFFAVEQRATATGPSRDGSATAGRRRRIARRRRRPASSGAGSTSSRRAPMPPASSTSSPRRGPPASSRPSTPPPRRMLRGELPEEAAQPCL
ncbi:hypothetical protein EE612_050301 [Oryza sativa]|nr:hypothetical protein EE612_050301 [Oryza sativa]